MKRIIKNKKNIKAKETNTFINAIIDAYTNTSTFNRQNEEKKEMKKKKKKNSHENLHIHQFELTEQ